MLVHLSFTNSSLTILETSQEQDQEQVATFPIYMPELEPLGASEGMHILPPSDNLFDNFFQILRAKNSDIPLAEWQNVSTLTSIVQQGWQTYWALFAGQTLRVPLDDSSPGRTVNGSYSYSKPRVTMAQGPTRAIQALLAGVLVAILVVSVIIPSASVLPKPPFSIAAQMSLVAGSQMLHLRDLQGTRSQRMGTRQLDRALFGYWFALRWWDRQEEGRRRFGVDMGVPGPGHDGSIERAALLSS